MRFRYALLVIRRERERKVRPPKRSLRFLFRPGVSVGSVFVGGVCSGCSCWACCEDSSVGGGGDGDGVLLLSLEGVVEGDFDPQPRKDSIVWYMYICR